ncbi:uncharacterized protein LOC126898328 [Daktulosphaira vitifoliae]|uniref:uncharacterized protein LOC126898328 n=1 Tax=Daktulosphaira vitifoliae TaxID=58002 RepID=UPI0021AAE593|nr:uncharacterized protein LOC126898328 [Daktulosphaira vitifoliae]
MYGKRIEEQEKETREKPNQSQNENPTPPNQLSEFGLTKGGLCEVPDMYVAGPSKIKSFKELHEVAPMTESIDASSSKVGPNQSESNRELLEVVPLEVESDRIAMEPVGPCNSKRSNMWTLKQPPKKKLSTNKI